jgi:hypothetical protein
VTIGLSPSDRVDRIRLGCVLQGNPSTVNPTTHLRWWSAAPGLCGVYRKFKRYFANDHC